MKWILYFSRSTRPPFVGSRKSFQVSCSGKLSFIASLDTLDNIVFHDGNPIFVDPYSTWDLVESKYVRLREHESISKVPSVLP